jgi:hypothetical protein
MNKGLSLVRHIKVIDVTQARDVQSTGQDIGSNQNFELPFFDLFDESHTSILRDVAGECFCLDAVGCKLKPNPLSHDFGVGKDDGTSGILFSNTSK